MSHVQSPLEVTFLLNLFCIFHSQTLLLILPALYNYRKLDSKSERSLCLIQKNILKPPAIERKHCSLKNDEPMNNHTYSLGVFVIMFRHNSNFKRISYWWCNTISGKGCIGVVSKHKGQVIVTSERKIRHEFKIGRNWQIDPQLDQCHRLILSFSESFSLFVDSFINFRTQIRLY